MRHHHSESQFRHALFVLQDADGYVDTLLEMARDHVATQRQFGAAYRFGGNQTGGLRGRELTRVTGRIEASSELMAVGP